MEYRLKMGREVGTSIVWDMILHIWHCKEASDSLTKLGFQRSVFQPSELVHKIRNVAVDIHVDGFLCSGQRDDLLWMYHELSKNYEMK